MVASKVPLVLFLAAFFLAGAGIGGYFFREDIVNALNPPYDPVPAFLEWGRQRNISTNLDLKQYGHANYGGVANGRIQEDEPLLRVPRAALISNQWVTNNTFLKDVTDWAGNESNGPLLVWLIHEKHNAHSDIKPYIDMLPQDFSNHPLTWSDELLESAKGTGVDVRVNSTRASLVLAHEHMQKMLLEMFPEEFEEFTYEDVLWAHLVIQTRTWQVTIEDETRDIVLVPWADMLNHKPGAGFGKLVDLEYFEIPAKQNYTKGEQVYDCYGQKSNMELIMGYGFALEVNPDDSTELNINLTPRYDTTPIGGKYALKMNTLPSELMKTLRKAYLEKEDLEDEEKMATLEAGHAISFTNERQAVYTALKAIMRGYDSVGTTIAADKRELAKEGLSFNERNINLLRKSQKDVLRNVMRAIKQTWERQLISRELAGGLKF